MSLGTLGLLFDSWYFQGTRNGPPQNQAVSVQGREQAGIHTV